MVPPITGVAAVHCAIAEGLAAETVDFDAVGAGAFHFEIGRASCRERVF